MDSTPASRQEWEDLARRLTRLEQAAHKILQLQQQKAIAGSHRDRQEAVFNDRIPEHHLIDFFRIPKKDYNNLVENDQVSRECDNR